jgi:ferredoxin-NADP reductase
MIDFILSSDTAFIGSSYIASPEDKEKYPSHLGMNQRGGLPGFVRVRKDGRTLVLPDFSGSSLSRSVLLPDADRFVPGNRLMTTLGNIETTPLASMTFVDFDSGDILYITGSAKNIIGSPAHEIMPFQKRLTVIHATGFIFVRDALPIRQKHDTPFVRSPYSPVIRLLAEESSMTLFNNDKRPEATLSRIELHDPHIATFTWTASRDLQIIPGQAIILDCSQFLGTQQYRHLAPTSDNDDCIRTWTVSSSSSKPTRTFSITLRHKPGGIVTSAFFNIAQKVALDQPEILDDTTSLNMTMKIAGISGEFVLPGSLSSLTTPVDRELVWFGGGIGLTPFLSMLGFLRMNRKDEDIAIRFILSTREPNILLPFIFNTYTGMGPSDTKSKIHVTLDVFNSGTDTMNDLRVPVGITLHQHAGRLDAEYIKNMKGDLTKGKQLYVCGPERYTELVIGELVKIGVRSDDIRTEVFAY